MNQFSRMCKKVKQKDRKIDNKKDRKKLGFLNQNLKPAGKTRERRDVKSSNVRKRRAFPGSSANGWSIRDRAATSRTRRLGQSSVLNSIRKIQRFAYGRKRSLKKVHSAAARWISPRRKLTNQRTLFRNQETRLAATHSRQ